jgi:transcriptional regulator with XRE-family HTH domain
MTFKEDLGARIRKARLDAGMTQSDVAKRVHTVISCVSNWETGKRNPGIEQLSILSQIFGIPIGDLVPLAHYEITDEIDQMDIYDMLEKINENEDEDQA